MGACCSPAASEAVPSGPSSECPVNALNVLLSCLERLGGFRERMRKQVLKQAHRTQGSSRAKG